MSYHRYLPRVMVYVILFASLSGNVYLWHRLAEVGSNSVVESQISPPERASVRISSARELKEAEISLDDLVRMDWEKIENSGKRLHAWEAWVSADPVAVLDRIVVEKEGLARLNMVSSVMRIWAETDPRAAARWLLHAPEGLFSEEPVQGLIDVWGQSNPAEAGEWLAGLNDTTISTTVAEVLAGTWAAEDGLATVRWIEANWPDGEAGTSLHMALDVWAESDLEGLRAALGSLGQMDVEIEAAKSVGVFLAETSPDEAWSFAGSLSEPSIRYETQLAVMESWADIAPSDAAKALGAMADGPSRVDSTRALASKWILSDPVKAENWISGLGSGDQADAGWEGAASHLEMTDPMRALRLATKMQQPELRFRVVESAYVEARAKDPFAADRWINEVGFPEEFRARLKRFD